MIPPWVNHFGKRTDWSLIYFLIYAYLNILAQSQILVISLYILPPFYDEPSNEYWFSYLTSKNVELLPWKITNINLNFLLHLLLFLKLIFTLDWWFHNDLRLNQLNSSKSENWLNNCTVMVKYIKQIGLKNVWIHKKKAHK